MLLKCIAIGNTKIKYGVVGRSQTFSVLKKHIPKNSKTIWFHCASLGEYEQGLPVFQEIKKQFPNHKIVLSFFSPSGYQNKKNNPLTNCVVYLPLDTKQNAKKFITQINPELSVFVKYDIWPNYLLTLKEHHKKAILISAVFRPDQLYFKWYGKLFKKALFGFTHIFVQHEASLKYLQKIGYQQVSISGDTRFDRVTNQLIANNNLPFIANFKQNSLCIVAGSTWPEDEAILIDYINQNASANLKFIIAPHNIHKNQIEKLRNSLTQKTLTYSEYKTSKKAPINYAVFIIDTIGYLSKIYAYADIAYIGGAMGKTGLHNTLEAAVFKIPIIIGKNFNKFPEAIAMQKNKGLFSVKNANEFHSVLTKLVQHPKKRMQAGKQNAKFVNDNVGAVSHIMQYLSQIT